jgi:hypothetical protein
LFNGFCTHICIFGLLIKALDRLFSILLLRLQK